MKHRDYLSPSEMGYIQTAAFVVLSEYCPMCKEKRPFHLGNCSCRWVDVNSRVERIMYEFRKSKHVEVQS